jgi:uncharacterized protein YegP (UPF0339 family)
MQAKFVIYKDKAGKFRFRLIATNGEIIAVGEAYESKASCLNGVKSIQKNAPIAGIVDTRERKKPSRKMPEPEEFASDEEPSRLSQLAEQKTRPVKDTQPLKFMPCRCISCTRGIL